LSPPCPPPLSLFKTGSPYVGQAGPDLSSSDPLASASEVARTVGSASVSNWN
jgi:hypothetical protein